jgi:peptide-methionine (R)-S-oxide reductase
MRKALEYTTTLVHLEAMRNMSSLLVAFLAFAGMAPVIADETKSTTSSSGASKRPVAEQPNKDGKVVKTEAEWKKKLTPEQYRVTREGGTERAFGKAYEDFHRHGEGTYYCVGCGAELFTSNEKFDSGCGWPSFYDPSKANKVTEHVDTSAGMVRTEVVCSVCDAHLGHVFNGEGYQTPTDKRYCINAAALLYVPASKKAAASSGKQKSPEKPKSKDEKEG